MAEASLAVFLIVIVVGVYFAAILFQIRRKRKLQENSAPRPPLSEFLAPYSVLEKKSFIFGTIVGIPLGVCSNLHLFFSESNPMPAFLYFIQVLAILILPSLLFVYVAIVRPAIFFNIPLKRKGVRFMEGIIWPSTIAGFVLFLSNPTVIYDMAKVCCKWI